MKNIFDVIGDLDNAAKVPALRAVTHSAMAKAIGRVRKTQQVIRLIGYVSVNRELMQEIRLLLTVL